MMLLKEQYGKQVIVNLLGSKGGEEVLNRAFKVKTMSSRPDFLCAHASTSHERKKIPSYQITGLIMQPCFL